MNAEAAADIDRFKLYPRAFIAVGSILLVLAGTTVALRVYTRTRIIHAFGLDDWLLVAAFVRSLPPSLFSPT